MWRNWAHFLDCPALIRSTQAEVSVAALIEQFDNQQFNDQEDVRRTAAAVANHMENRMPPDSQGQSYAGYTQQEEDHKDSASFEDVVPEDDHEDEGAVPEDEDYEDEDYEDEDYDDDDAEDESDCEHCGEIGHIF